VSEFVFGISQDQVEPAVLLDYGMIDRLTNSNLLFPHVTGDLFSGRNDFNVSIFAQSNFSAVQFSSPFRNMETDDFAGDASTTGVVDRNGGTIAGQIDFSGDSDWFAVDLAAGEILRVVNPVFNSDVGVVLRDADGNLVDSNFGPPTSLGGASFGRGTVLRADQAGTYYLDVSSSARSANYSLTTEVVTDDFADDETTLGVIPTDGTVVQGRIDFEDDTDWFAITVEANQVIRLTLNQGQIYGLRSQSPELNVFSANDREYVFDASAAGTYFFSVTDFGSTRSLDDYNLTAEIIQDDFASDSSTEGRVTIGQTINGQINFEGDTDWFEITLTGDEVVVIETEADFNFPEFNFNLVNSDGDILEFSSTTFFFDGNIVQRLVIDQAYSGLFYISVQGEPGAGSNQPVDYTFSAASFQDDFAGNATSEGVISIGENASGRIDFAGDEDWFAINLTEGEIVRIRSTEDIGLALFSANGQRFASGNVPSDAAFLSELITDGTLSGTFYVAVEFGLEGTNYILESDIIEDDFSNDANTTGVVPQTGITTGSIDFNNDSDWFAITLTAGETIRIRTDSDTGLFLSLVDEFGSFLAFSSDFNVLGSDEPFDGINDQELSALVSESGTYFINVEGFSPGSYTLTSAVLEDDFVADVSTTGELLLGGSVTGVIDAVSDEDWFRIELTEGDFIRIASDSGNVRLTLLDENGQFVNSGQFVFGPNGDLISTQIVETVFATGTYYLAVSADSNSVGDYTISSDIVTDDFADDTSTTGVIETGGTATGVIEVQGDEDWFAIELTESQRVNFTVQSELSENLVLQIADTNGDIVVFQSGEIDFMAGISGTFYVSVSSLASENNTAYELTATEILPINGTSGDDILFGTDRDDVINGLEGNDVIFISPNDDIIDGGDGTDTINASNTMDRDSGFLIDLDLGQVIDTQTGESDQLISIENAVGSNSNDTLISNNAGSILIAGDGSDTLRGGSGDDALFGESGTDFLYGSSGADIMDGGEGEFDRVIYNLSDAAVFLNFATGEFSGGHAEGDVVSNVEIVLGSDFDDIITGNEFTLGLEGGRGNDTIIATQLADPNQLNFLLGGAFTESFLNEGTGDDTLIGSAGQDVLIGFDGADFMDGGDGIDTVRYNYDFTSGEGVVIDLEAGTASGGHAEGDTLLNIENVTGSIFADFIQGDGNANTLLGGSGGDVLDGRDGDDLIIGAQGFDVLTGGAGADTFSFTFASDDYTDIITDFEDSDILSFGAERDFFGNTVALSFIGQAEFSNVAGQLRYVAVVPEASDPAVTIQTLIQFDADGDGIADEEITLFNYDAGLFAIANEFGGFNLISGIAGTASRDFLRGTGEDDFIAGGAGSDRIFGEAGNDQLFGDAGNDIIVAGNGDDSVFGGEGNDRILAGNGDDQVEGGNGDDNILGGSGDDTLSGGDGADRIEGQANNDIINGGDGNDTILGGNGRDLISGDLGNDVLRGEDGNDLIEGNAGDDFLGGGGGNDLLIGGRGADRLYAGSGEDRLFGQQGEDILFGGGGNDRLFGGGGNDVLNGQSGDDILDGGSANDILTGGGGADIFVFNASATTTTVTDFTDGVDLLDLSDFSDADIQNALDTAVSQDGDSVLTFSNGAVLVLEGFDLNDLSDEDILGFDSVDMTAAIA